MRYPLRLRRQGVHIELMICVTVSCKEADGSLQKTLRAIAAAVCIIVDGRTNMPFDVANYASRTMRIFDSTLIELRYAGRDTTMHVFERSVEMPKHTMAREYFPPLQLIFGVTEHPGG